MSGIRIRHRSERGCVLVVPHPRKDYLIHIDGAGFAMVSPKVYERLREAAGYGIDHGFEFNNEVKAPPPLRIGFDRKIEYVPAKKIIEEAIRSIAPKGTRVTVDKR